jgi:WhiB family redox-sensing transcriptional regulator
VYERAVTPMAAVASERAWRENALCRSIDPEAFFADDQQSTAMAKAACMFCPIAADCLAYALDNNEQYGVWGGFTAHERQLMQARVLA